MSRRRHGGGSWGVPYMMYSQPTGWGDFSMGMGYGSRGQQPARTNDLCSPFNSGSEQALSLDSLSSLFTRLILQNHLNRLAGDALDLGGGGGRGGLWGCSVPASSPCSQQRTSCASSPPVSNCHPQGQSSGCDSVNKCCHTNNINVCHTCPAATRPYMGTNNVFVMPAAHVQQQQQPGGGFGNLGNFNPNQNNLNMFLNGLGLAMGSNNGCGGVPVGLQGGFPLNDLGVGIGGPAVNGGGLNFSCRGCNFQM